MDAPLDAERHARPTTARSRELGWELHLARKRANLTATAVAEELGWSLGKLSKLENGWRGADPWDYGTLLGRLGADRRTRDRVRRIASEQDVGLFARPLEDRVPDRLTCVTIHERAALTMQGYDPMVVPGLLQTEAYARAVVATSGALSDAELDAVVRIRVERQAVLTGERSPETTCYIHETALRSVVGGDRVMHDQMMRLVFMCGWKRLHPRVVPLAAGGHWALGHSYNLMTFGRGLAPVVYTENDVSAVFAEEEGAVERFRHKSACLDELALDVERSRRVFSQWATVYGRRAQRGAD
ncbi:helix-turn-helix transcriptional regulator [Umezawaea sp.]|uniref:helix-turn-helix domain-containing protein n=1 Tax=Umezawaea sp. TaxID=1955258 RepID=UPI002ED4C32B